MMFTQMFTIPDIGGNPIGELRIGTIGGNAYDGEIPNQQQVGHIIPIRHGILQVSSIGAERRILDCLVDVVGYYGREIMGCKAPARIVVEFPSSITVRGPAGLQVLVEAWILDSYQDRGAIQSALPAAGILIPVWASSFDLASPGVATFRNTLGAIVGVVPGNTTNFSIPTGAATVDLAGANTPIVFRQG